MTPQELDIVKRELCLQHITDPTQLQILIEARLASMNAIDRAALTMRIGTKVQEAESLSPGAAYSPSSSSLVATAVVFCLLAVGAVLLVIDTELWVVLKLVAGALAVFWFITAWRAIARVTYRSANGRDM
jgi:hypothetical protein